jgi:hypothetical protein
MSLEAPTCTGSRITVEAGPGGGPWVIVAIRGPQGGWRRRELVHQAPARALARGILATPAAISVATRAGGQVTVEEATRPPLRARRPTGAARRATRAATVPDPGDCLVLAILGRHGDVRNRELLAREAAWELARGLLAMLAGLHGEQEGAGQ